MDTCPVMETSAVSMDPYKALSASVILSALDDFFEIDQSPSELRRYIRKLSHDKHEKISERLLKNLSVKCHFAETAEQFLLRDKGIFFTYCNVCGISGDVLRSRIDTKVLNKKNYSRFRSSIETLTLNRTEAQPRANKQR